MLLPPGQSTPQQSHPQNTQTLGGHASDNTVPNTWAPAAGGDRAVREAFMRHARCDRQPDLMPPRRSSRLPDVPFRSCERGAKGRNATETHRRSGSSLITRPNVSYVTTIVSLRHRQPPLPTRAASTKPTGTGPASGPAAKGKPLRRRPGIRKAPRPARAADPRAGSPAGRQAGRLHERASPASHATTPRCSARPTTTSPPGRPSRSPATRSGRCSKTTSR